MKIFLSWSGQKSHQVALAFKDWLPLVIQCIDPYVSSDIDKGIRWSTDIAKELENSSFGILCVTKDNIEAPWLLFEAGALSRMMDKHYVCPFLFDLRMAEIKSGPLLQFQTTVLEKDDIKKLLKTINKSCGDSAINEDLLEKTFNIWWPNLEESLDNIMEEKSEDKPSSKKLNNDDMLEELLELARINQKFLRSPETILPVDYVRNVVGFRPNNGTVPLEINLYNELYSTLNNMQNQLNWFNGTIQRYQMENRPVDNELIMEFMTLSNTNIQRLLSEMSRQDHFK